MSELTPRHQQRLRAQLTDLLVRIPLSDAQLARAEEKYRRALAENEQLRAKAAALGGLLHAAP